tara:strand:- start:855 stop:1058 length:204 start_codon:yes stop_codon:yes gene_type:complete
MFRGGIILTLSRDYRLRLSELCYRIKLGRDVSLDERVWMNKLCEHNKSAKGLVETLMCPDFLDEYPL